MGASSSGSRLTLGRDQTGCEAESCLPNNAARLGSKNGQESRVQSEHFTERSELHAWHWCLHICFGSLKKRWVVEVVRMFVGVWISSLELRSSSENVRGTRTDTARPRLSSQPVNLHLPLTLWRHRVWRTGARTVLFAGRSWRWRTWRRRSRCFERRSGQTTKMSSVVNNATKTSQSPGGR